MCIDGFIVHICTAYVRVYLSHLIIVSFHLRLFYFMSIFFSFWIYPDFIFHTYSIQVHM